MIPLGEHAYDLLLQADEIGIEVQAEARKQSTFGFAAFGEFAEGAAGSEAIEFRRVLDYLRAAAETGDDGHLTGEESAQGIDSLDLQGRGVDQEIPAIAGILAKNSFRQFIAFRFGEGVLNTLLKFGGSFAGKGHRNDAFRDGRPDSADANNAGRAGRFCRNRPGLAR